MTLLTAAHIAALDAIKLPVGRQILREVAAATGTTPAALTGQSRIQKIAHARQIACHAMRMQGMSLEQIGRVVNRDHTTVIHAIRAVEKRMEASQ